MAKHIVVTEQLGDKGAVWTADGNLAETADICRNGQYEKAIDSYKEALARMTQLGDKREVAKVHENIGKIYIDIGQYQNAIDFFSKTLEIDEELGDKEEIARTRCNIGILYNRIGQHRKALECHLKALMIAQPLGDKEVIGWIYDNIGLNHESIGEFREAIEFHLKALEISKDLGDKRKLAKTQLCLGNLYDKIDRQCKGFECHHIHLNIAQELTGEKRRENMENVCIVSIGDQYDKSISCHHKHTEIAEWLGDKQDAKTLIRRNNGIMSNGIVGTTGFHKQSDVRGMLGMTQERRKHLICKCIFILSNTDSISPQIIERFQEALILQDFETTRGGVVVRFTPPVVKVTYQKFLNVAAIDVDAKAANNDVVCHCNTIFATIEGVLLEEGLSSHSVNTCQEDSVMLGSGGAQGSPTDAELFITKVESLTTEMCLVKNAIMISQLTRDVSREDGDKSATLEGTPSEYHLNETRWKQSAEMKSICQGILQQLRLLYEELGIRKNTRALQGKETKSIQSDASAMLTSLQDVCPACSEDADMINETPEMNYGVQNPADEGTTTITEENYPVSMLLEYFASSLQEHDWDEFRRVMQYHIPENVLRNLPNGIGIFEELVDRNFVSDRDMKLLRDVFYQIQRIDCVHLIDRAKESDCSFLAENAQAVNVVVGRQNVSSVAAGQEIRRTPVEGHRPKLGRASGFLTLANVRNGTDRLAATNESKQLVLREAHIGTGAQGQRGDDELSRECNNSPRTGTSYMQNAAPRANPVLQESDIVRKCQIWKEGTQAGFDANKATGLSTTTRGTRPSESEEQTGHDDEINKGSGGEGSSSWAKDIQFSCGHYERYCDVQFGCCERFWPCHRCHNSESQCEVKKLRAKDITKIRCKRCSRVQEFPKENPSCVECGLKFAEYFCAPCQHLTGRENNPYHCDGCGICRVKEDRSFHCDVCGVCMDVKLLENHTCRHDSAHDECCICFEDAFYGCHILPCTHKVHVNCAKMMLKNGIKKCPVCRKPFSR